MDVMTLPWPADPTPVDAERIDAARATGRPILLLVADGAEPPALAGCLEDWVRLGAPDVDRLARSAALTARATHHGPRPALDEGVLRYRDRWVSLSPVEHRLAASLVERFGAVVGRDSLSRRAWPDGVPSRNALDVHMLRLRRRLDPLGLEVRTVRARGYLLQSSGG